MDGGGGAADPAFHDMYTYLYIAFSAFVPSMNRLFCSQDESAAGGAGRGRRRPGAGDRDAGEGGRARAAGGGAGAGEGEGRGGGERTQKIITPRHLFACCVASLLLALLVL